jgi:uncharacterized membrane protein YphA (DoxX/SURF4 family)
LNNKAFFTILQSDSKRQKYLDKQIPHLLKKIVKSRWVHFVIRFVLGSIFVYAGFIKLIDPKAFARVISQYGIVPDVLLVPFAIGLPALEFLAGLGLMLNMRGSLTIIFSLLVVFVGVLGYGILNSLNVDCGCFSPEEIKGQNNLRHAFYRDLVMIAGVFLLFFSRSNRVLRNVRGCVEKNKLSEKEDA